MYQNTWGNVPCTMDTWGKPGHMVDFGPIGPENLVYYKDPLCNLDCTNCLQRFLAARVLAREWLGRWTGHWDTEVVKGRQCPGQR